MPIHAPTLLTDLKRWVTRFEDDLRRQCKDVPTLDARLKAQYKQAKDAGRTAFAYTVWRDGELTQSAVGWVLSCVFVRFLEDNDLLERSFLSGVGENRGVADETRAAYFRENRAASDNDYLAHVMSEVGKLPGMADLMDARHNALWNAAISPDAAKAFIEFWRRIDPGTGKMAHDFSDASPSSFNPHPSSFSSTRFLGDLYQDLSESARKKFALLQTPDFVEEFILDRTLDPAIDKFGLKVVRMIDPTCGSGHFLLGGFRRLLALWEKQRPDLSDKERAVKALDGVFGVDINPFAVAIARFRLLLAAWRYCGVKRLRSAPDFKVNLACGDSLLHGARFDAEGKPYTIGRESLFGGDELVFKDETAHHFEVEDAKELHRILGQQYHAVVGNPPYITVKDKALNELYRQRYDSCSGKYALSVPFMERIFDLAVTGSNDDQRAAGFTGQITANSFMKRGFGKKLITEFIRDWDLTHVIDASGAYIPGHGTPTVILLGRNVKPKTATVRTVMGIKGEPATPEDPSKGLVWSAVIDQVDRPGSESDFVSAGDTEREKFLKHPWSIGGGGAAELRDEIESVADCRLENLMTRGSIGAVTGEDEALAFDSISRHAKKPITVRYLIEGDNNRDWGASPGVPIIFPYDALAKPMFDPSSIPLLWNVRTNLQTRIWFRTPHRDRGMNWWEYAFLSDSISRSPKNITFAEVATHNHFVLDRGGKVFKQTAPVIKLPSDATEEAHLRLLGLLNSSSACFWIKQVFYPKGGDHVGQEGARVRKTLWDERFQIDGTKMKQFPVMEMADLTLVTAIQQAVDAMSVHAPEKLLASWSGCDGSLAENMESAGRLCDLHRRRLIYWQEELDWQVYELYGLIDPSDELALHGDRAVDTLYDRGLSLGERTFEIFMARQMARGTFNTTWFERHKESGSRPITEPPADWPEAYTQLYARRHAAIQENKNLNLIERPEYKRRWNTEPWAKRQQAALEKWLLIRLETYFHDADRMVSGEDEAATATKLAHIRPLRARFAGGSEPRIVSVRQLAATAQTDPQWIEAATVFAGRADFDVPQLVEKLVLAESVPALPADRYKDSGLRHRIEWEKTWELQREEDRIDAERQSLEDRIERRVQLVVEEQHAYRLEQIAGKKKELEAAEHAFHQEFFPGKEYDPEHPHNAREHDSPETERFSKKINLQDLAQALGWQETELRRLRQQIQREDEQVVELQARIDDLPLKPDIPVPPKYKGADFKKTSYWKLRGKLDVPKERWVVYPGMEGGHDASPVIAWAGWDHAQQAAALTAFYQQAKDTWGWAPERLAPLLAALKELLPWLHQWHNAIDPEYGDRPCDSFQQFYTTELHALRMTDEDIEKIRMNF